MMRFNTRLGIKRVAAFGVDWLLIALYAAALFAATTLIHDGMPTIPTPYNPLVGQLIGFASLTLPVVSYFIVAEYYFGYTIGKQVLRLRVIAESGGKPPFSHVFVRNVIKFLPWEMAHYTIHQFTAANLLHQEPSIGVYIVLGILYVLVGLYLVELFWSNRGPLYDRIARIHVIQDAHST